MEKLNLHELYAETFFSMQEVIAGRQHMYGVYILQEEADGSVKKLTCQSLFCSGQPQEIDQVLTERRELLMKTHNLEVADVEIYEMPLEQVEQMFNKLGAEAAQTPNHH